MFARTALSPMTSPRLRGEVEICAKREFRVRGTIRESGCMETPLTPTLSPQGRGEGGYRRCRNV